MTHLINVGCYRNMGLLREIKDFIMAGNEVMQLGCIHFLPLENDEWIVSSLPMPWPEQPSPCVPWQWSRLVFNKVLNRINDMSHGGWGTYSYKLPFFTANTPHDELSNVLMELDADGIKVIREVVKPYYHIFEIEYDAHLFYNMNLG